MKDDDKQAFTDAMADVTPLDDHNRHTPNRAPVKPKARFRRRDEQAVLVESLHSNDVVDHSGGDYFKRPGVQHKTMRRLQRGQLSIENEIDLHGMTVAEATDALIDFIKRSVTRGERCVRVIHGKGHRSGAGGPKLKPMVEQRLRQLDAVLGFCSARPNDGGSGALYVLLRKI